MNLTKRIEVLENKYKTWDLGRGEMEGAFTVLSRDLHASLPNEEPKRVLSPIHNYAIAYNYQGCLGFSDKLGLLMKNIEDGVVSEGDQAVLDSLPQWALDTVGISAVEYVTMVNELFNRY
jgi:hypothetical protein